MKANALWFLFWIAIAIGGASYIQTQQQQTSKQHRRVAEETAQQQSEELSATEQNLRALERSNAARRKTELDRALGGPVAAAFKNPAFALREALQRAAEACAPTNSIVLAEVDRFTEFTVTIDSGDELSRAQMIAFARRFMPFARDYLYALRFSHRGAIIGELDRQDIDFVDDWAAIPDQRIAMLLPREVPLRAVDPAAIDRLRDEERIGSALAADPSLREKTTRANRNLHQSIQNANGELTLALQGLQKSISLNELRSVADLDSHEKDFRAALDHLKTARDFWTNPTAQWQKLLDAENIQGDLREALVKGFPAMFRTDATKTKKLFDALDGEAESCRYVLKLLTEGTQKWKFYPSGGIVFLDDDLARRFQRAGAQAREDMEAVDAALRQWSEAVGP
jgi:hypothetical protein